MMMIISASALAADPSQYSPQLIFKNWALSGCLSHALHSEDAERAAAAYVEFGTTPIEGYAEGSKLIEKFLKKDYVAKEGGTLHTMKCIDLFHSKELDVLTRKYTK